MQRWDQRWRQGQDQEEEIVQEKKELIRILRETPRGRLKYDRQWGQDQSGDERGTHLGTEMEGETSIGDMMKRSSSLHPSSPLLVPDGPASGHVWHSVMEEVAEEMLEMKLQTIAGVAKELEMKEKKGEREGEGGRKEMRGKENVYSNERLQLRACLDDFSGSPQGNPPGETSSSTSRSKHKRKDPAPHKISKSQVTNPVPTSPVDATLHMMDLKLNQELQSAKMNRRRSTLERRRELWEETEAKKREKSKELELENQRKEEALEKEVARLKREQEQEMRELQNLQKKRLEDLRAARAERKIADDHIKATATLEEAIERMKALAQKVELDPHPAEALKNSLTVLQTLKEYGPDPKLILAANTAAVAIEKLVETISIDLAAAAEEEEERLQRAQAEAVEAEKARKAEEERTRKQKEEAERQQQQLKLQKQQLEQQAQASVQPEISQANLERLQAVMNHKARVSAAADEMANNPALKRFRGDCQKVISTTVNEINAQSSEFLRKKLETLRLAITGQQVVYYSVYKVRFDEISILNHSRRFPSENLSSFSPDNIREASLTAWTRSQRSWSTLAIVLLCSSSDTATPLSSSASGPTALTLASSFWPTCTKRARSSSRGTSGGGRIRARMIS